MIRNIKIVAAFRGMHVSPAKHSYAWLPRKCYYRTDRRRTKWSLCAAMLHRRHNNSKSSGNSLPERLPDIAASRVETWNNRSASSTSASDANGFSFILASDSDIRMMASSCLQEKEHMASHLGFCISFTRLHRTCNTCNRSYSEVWLPRRTDGHTDTRLNNPYKLLC